MKLKILQLNSSKLTVDVDFQNSKFKFQKISVPRKFYDDLFTTLQR